MEEFNDNWWDGCVDGNGRVHLEELPGCFSSVFWAFSATSLVYALINVGGRMYGPCATFDVVSGRYENSTPIQLRCYLKKLITLSYMYPPPPVLT